MAASQEGLSAHLDFLMAAINPRCELSARPPRTVAACPGHMAVFGRAGLRLYVSVGLSFAAAAPRGAALYRPRSGRDERRYLWI
jgi:hypothetical protein